MTGPDKDQKKKCQHPLSLAIKHLSCKELNHFIYGRCYDADCKICKKVWKIYGKQKCTERGRP